MLPAWFILSGASPRVVARAPEEIGAQRAADRAAGVLRQDQASQRSVGKRLRGRQKNGRAERQKARIDGDRSARGQRHAEGADRAIDAVARIGRHFPEKDVARILVEQRGQLVRMLPSPGLDPLHRRRFQGQLTAIDEHAPDRPVRKAVLIGVTDAHAAAIGKLEPGPSPAPARRTLRPGHRARPAPCPTCRALPASMSARDQYGTTRLPSRRPRTRSFLSAGKSSPKSTVSKSSGGAYKRIAVAIGAHAAALEQRLVVARHSSEVDPIRGHHPVWGKLRFEKRARAGVVVRCDGRRGGAGVPPDRRRFASRVKRAAARGKRRQGVGWQCRPSSRAVLKTRPPEATMAGSFGRAELERATVAQDASSAQSAATQECIAMGWILLEALVALILAVFIVWFTMGGRRKPPSCRPELRDAERRRVRRGQPQAVIAPSCTRPSRLPTRRASSRRHVCACAR